MLKSNLSTTSKKLVLTEELARFGPDQAESISLAQASAYCSRWAASHPENFMVASVLLPRSLRQDFHNIYAYCRWSDDLADEIRDPQQSLQLLDWWQRALEQCVHGQPRHPILIALQQTIRRHSLELEPFSDLLHAFRQDQQVRRYVNDVDLLDYCQYSANPVGRILLQLGRAATPTSLRLSDAVCTGLQLANFCQDMSRDAEQGRIYFPQTRWLEHCVDEDMLLNRHVTPELRRGLAHWVGTARQSLLQGWPLVELVPGWLRTDVDLFVRGGLAILQAIEAQQYDVWTTRPQVGKWTQAKLLATSLLNRNSAPGSQPTKSTMLAQHHSNNNGRSRTRQSLDPLRIVQSLATSATNSPDTNFPNDAQLSSSVCGATTARLNHREPESAELRASRQWCAQVCRQSKSSFLASFALLDSPRRQATGALYAFARITDDLGDSPQPASLRAAKLQHLRTQLWQHCDPRATYLPIQSPSLNPHPLPTENFETNPSSTHEPSLDFTLLWPALTNCVERYQIPVQLLDDIIAGVSMDVQHQQPSDWNDLRHYCHHVASAVGLICTHIWRDSERAFEIPTQAACDCGFAFQLTNILRDIGEDSRAGRIYIPHSMFNEYSVDRHAWLASQPTGNWQAMLDEIAERANKLYAAGWPTIHILSPRSSRMFSLIWHSYRELLPALMANKELLWTTQKLRLSKARRLRMLTTHALAPLKMLIR